MKNFEYIKTLNNNRLDDINKDIDQYIELIIGAKKSFDTGFLGKTTDFLDRASDTLFSSQKGCLLAKFLLYFGGAMLSKSNRQLLIEGMKESGKNYPIIKELETKIFKLRGLVFDFFEEYKKNQEPYQKTTALSKTGNSFADYIIKIDIERMIDFQNTHYEGRGPGNSFSISFEEREDDFLIKLER